MKKIIFYIKTYCYYIIEILFVFHKIPKKFRLDHRFVKITRFNISNLHYIDKKWFYPLLEYYNVFSCKQCGMTIINDDIHKYKIPHIMNKDDKNLEQFVTNCIMSPYPRKIRYSEYYSCKEFIVKQIIK